MLRNLSIALAVIFISMIPLLAQDDAPAPDARQKATAKTFASHLDRGRAMWIACWRWASTSGSSSN